MGWSEADPLLGELGRRRWVVHLFGRRDAPWLLAAVFAWQTCADVVLLRGEHDATAYRVPTFPGTDVFAPELVSWQYHAGAVWTLRVALTLPPPGHPRAPMQILRPSVRCTVPPEMRRPETIRPAAPGAGCHG
ncbi:hypothetical protein F8178_16655 [Haloechinothrix sp. LS1_15]|nr:hypothetical protein [Haloechinothrix sp. LS1_15]